MCNLYQITPKDWVEKQFSLIAPNGYPQGVVGPFGQGAFVRPSASGLELVEGQWGMIAPGAKSRRPAGRGVLTNNARIEGVHERWTYRDAWRRGQRCLIPALWYQEPNWETGKNIWWHMRRADGAPWALAGLWSEWTDPETGEMVPSYTMITCNCDGHPLLGRLHKPDPKLPDDQQDKRAVVQVDPQDWERWLHGTVDEARALVSPAPMETFDLSVTAQTDQTLAQRAREPEPGLF